IKEKEAQLFQLNEDLSKLKAKITHLEEETEIQKKKNNELREKNWKAMDALKAAEDSAEQKIKEIQTTADKKLSQVHKEYEQKLQNSGKSDSGSLELNQKLTKAEAELAKRISDFNSEVEKNNKLTAEVGKINTEKKTAESRLAQIEESVGDVNQIKECLLRTRECLQRIHPEVSIDSSLPHESWVAEFEKQVDLAGKSTSSSVNETEFNRLKDLLENKDKELSAKEKHFSQVLSDTQCEEIRSEIASCPLEVYIYVANIRFTILRYPNDLSAFL
ncbi:kinectin, partial [Nephila pilipes]